MPKSVTHHDRKLTLHLVEEVPEHEPREDYNDDVYQASRTELIDNQGLGCFICGRTEADLKNDDGYGRYLETHHFFVEWSLWNAVSPERVRALRDSSAIDIYGYSRLARGDPVKRPGEIWNLMVLCPRHHRYAPDPGKGFGIHNGPFPLWLAQRQTKNDYQLLSDKDE